MPDYKVVLVYSGIGFELEPYTIVDCRDEAAAILRAKAHACVYLGLAFQPDEFGVVSIEEVDPDPHWMVV